MVPGAVDETFLKLQSKRLRQPSGAMSPREEDRAIGASDAFYDSLRWMDENEGPDLRLGFEALDHALQDKAPPTRRGLITRPSSFRRRMSITKKSFSRTSSMAGNSRPGTKDTTAAPSLHAASSPPPANQSGHVRRKSRALSLISPNKQSARESPPTIDPAAAYYRDPGTRTTLREYMLSPQKFDEALAYGFPSLGDVDENEDPRKKSGPHTFLGVDRSSEHSTVSDPDSPKTPPILEKPMMAQSARACTDPMPPRLSCGPTLNNPREMTLRMTLTRSDLRAHEDQMYRWQTGAAARNAHTRVGSLAPATPDKDADLKEAMEKHFAALDQEHLDTHDDGVVRRFWKRVRRS